MWTKVGGEGATAEVSNGSDGGRRDAVARWKVSVDSTVRDPGMPDGVPDQGVRYLGVHYAGARGPAARE